MNECTWVGREAVRRFAPYFFWRLGERGFGNRLHVSVGCLRRDEESLGS